jgi:hypothetical protein
MGCTEIGDGGMVELGDGDGDMADLADKGGRVGGRRGLEKREQERQGDGGW